MRTIAFFLTREAQAGRKARGCPFVALVEMPSGDFVEFDADSADHAVTLALNWTRPELGAMAASCWRVLRDGSLLDRPFRICDFRDHLPDDFWSEEAA